VLGAHAPLARAAQRSRSRPIAHDQDDPRADDRVVEERLEVRPVSRGEYRDPMDHPGHARQHTRGSQHDRGHVRQKRALHGAGSPATGLLTRPRRA